MDKYISIQELADLKGVSTRAIRMSRDKYVTREIIVRDGKSFEILLSSIEPEFEEKYLNQKNTNNFGFDGFDYCHAIKKSSDQSE